VGREPRWLAWLEDAAVGERKVRDPNSRQHNFARLDWSVDLALRAATMPSRQRKNLISRKPSGIGPISALQACALFLDLDF